MVWNWVTVSSTFDSLPGHTSYMQASWLPGMQISFKLQPSLSDAIQVLRGMRISFRSVGRVPVRVVVTGCDELTTRGRVPARACVVRQEIGGVTDRAQPYHWRAEAASR